MQVLDHFLSQGWLCGQGAGGGTWLVFSDGESLGLLSLALRAEQQGPQGRLCLEVEWGWCQTWRSLGQRAGFQVPTHLGLMAKA